MFIDFIQSYPHVHKFQPILNSNISLVLESLEKF